MTGGSYILGVHCTLHAKTYDMHAWLLYPLPNHPPSQPFGFSSCLCSDAAGVDSLVLSLPTTVFFTSTAAFSTCCTTLSATCTAADGFSATAGVLPALTMSSSIGRSM